MQKLIFILAFSFILSACKTSKTNLTQDRPTQSLTGTVVTKSPDGNYILKSSDVELHTVASQKYDLSKYLNQSITGTGMPSGDTLYIDTLQ